MSRHAGKGSLGAACKVYCIVPVRAAAARPAKPHCAAYPCVHIRCRRCSHPSIYPSALRCIPAHLLAPTLQVAWTKVTEGSINELFEYFATSLFAHNGALEPAFTVEALRAWYADPAKAMANREKSTAKKRYANKQTTINPSLRRLSNVQQTYAA